MAAKAILDNLKRELGPLLVTSEQVAPPPGLPTGWPKLDRYLLWHGFPKGAITLMLSEGGGATGLWIRSIAPLTQAGQWAAWINNGDSDLAPWIPRRRGCDLSKLLVVSHPKDIKQLLWAMQELMALCLFESIGCDLGALRLSEAHVLKLKKLAIRYKTAIVLVSSQDARKAHISSFYSLVLHFGRTHVTALRAQHRPTPFALERRELYADTLPLLAAGRRALCG